MEKHKLTSDIIFQRSRLGGGVWLFGLLFAIVFTPMTVFCAYLFISFLLNMEILRALGTLLGACLAGFVAYLVGWHFIFLDSIRKVKLKKGRIRPIDAVCIEYVSENTTEPDDNTPTTYTTIKFRGADGRIYTMNNYHWAPDIKVNEECYIVSLDNHVVIDARQVYNKKQWEL